jgi:hypothetical protein
MDAGYFNFYTFNYAISLMKILELGLILFTKLGTNVGKEVHLL